MNASTTDRDSLSGIILSGGKSLRMGRNKAFIEIEGIPIIKRIHSLFKNLFQEVLIVTNQKELFVDFDARVYEDILPNTGVIGGLYTGILHSKSHYSFVVACDMPYLKESVIRYLIQRIEGSDAVIPRTLDGLQPLHAIYSKGCLEPIQRIMEKGNYKIIDFYEGLNVTIVNEEEFRHLDPRMESFINVNTPEELSVFGVDRSRSPI